jgi:hypothetical protein
MPGHMIGDGALEDDAMTRQGHGRDMFRGEDMSMDTGIGRRVQTFTPRLRVCIFN